MMQKPIPKPTLTRDMLNSLGTDEARMRAVYELSKNKVPVEPELFEDALVYFMKNDLEKAARIYSGIGNQDRANEIYMEMSLNFEKQDNLEKALDYARTKKRKKRLQAKIIKKEVAEGEFWDAACDAERFDFYKMAIKNFINYSLINGRFEGVNKAADIADSHDDSLWAYFAEQSRATDRKDIIEAAAVKLKETEKLDLALELYKVLGDQREIRNIADDLGEYSIALDAILASGDYESAASYAKRTKQEDRLPDIYELGLRHCKEEGKYWKATDYAEKLGRFSEAIEFYEKEGKWVSAAKLAEEQGLAEIRERNLRNGLKEYEEKGSYGSALNIAKKLGISGEELLKYQEKALDEYEKEFNLDSASSIASQMGLKEKVQAYALLGLLKQE